MHWHTCQYQGHGRANYLINSNVAERFCETGNACCPILEAMEMDNNMYNIAQTDIYILNVFNYFIQFFLF